MKQISDKRNKRNENDDDNQFITRHMLRMTAKCGK